MSLIEDFLEQYNKQYDFYSELAKIGCGKLESILAKRGIKAIVSFRAKKPERLRTKLQQRIEEKGYQNIIDIFTDIVDLAGVRVALYFPSERDLVDEVVNDLFIVNKKKNFPESSHKPKYTKRFSGYWASHYRVVLKQNEPEYERYQNTQFEIQVASVLMHAWSEVEHDLVYKPLSGELSEDELAILDQINGLVLSGEIALERLQKAMANRTENKKEISDRYELTNYIVSSLDKKYLSKLKLGNTDTLNNWARHTTGKLYTDVFSKYLKNVNKSESDTISDQLLYMYVSDLFQNKDKNYLTNYFKSVSGPNVDTSGFESFVKTWIIFEKALKEINRENNITHKKYVVPNLDILSKYNFTTADIDRLYQFRNMRNQLLHGIETPPDDFLIKASMHLKELTQKAIESINEESVKVKLNSELIDINNKI